MITEKLRDFIKVKCSYLEEFHKGIGVDHLDKDDTAYMISTVPAKKIIKTYIDGSSDRQYVFAFCSRESYGPDVRRQIENIKFYELFDEWLDECTETKDFPDLGENIQVKKIEAQSTGYLFDVGADKARYQIQCRVIYHQNK